MRYKRLTIRKSKIRTIEVCCGHGNKCNGKDRSFSSIGLA